MWRQYVQTGCLDDVVGDAWDACLVMGVRLARESELAYVAWSEVAYPLYGIPAGIEEASDGTATT